MTTPPIPQHYRQTETFTCGPAALIVALQFLGRLTAAPSKRLELDFWRRANTIFMGEGMPGCGPYGLGCIALDHGCAAALFTSAETGHFKQWNDAAQNGEAADIIEAQDRARFLSLGGHVHPAEALRFAGNDLHAILALEGGDDMRAAHWVCFIKDGEDLYLKFDPEEEGEPAPYSAGELYAGTHYMGQKTFLWLSA